MARRIPKPKNKPNFGNKAKRRKLIEHNLKVLKELDSKSKSDQ